VVSRVKRDFACTLTDAVPPELVVLRAQSHLGLGAGTYAKRAIPGSDLSRVIRSSRSAGPRVPSPGRDACGVVRQSPC